MNSLIDSWLSSNARLQAFAAALLALHVVAGFWAWRRGGQMPVLVLNAALSATIWLYHAPRLTMSIASQDTAVLALLAFEAVGFAVCVIGLCGWRVPRSLVWLIFAANATMSAMLVLFAFTFRITRLF